MLCTYCATPLGNVTAAPFRKSAVCRRCAGLLKLMFVTRQGDGVTGFREIMIRQIPKEPNRKLLETQSFHFTVFLDERLQVVGFELTDRGEEHLLKWRRGSPAEYFAVSNVGKGYHNRDEMRRDGDFESADVIAELKTAGRNIRSPIREALLEGITAFARP